MTYDGLVVREEVDESAFANTSHTHHRNDKISGSALISDLCKATALEHFYSPWCSHVCFGTSDCVPSFVLYLQNVFALLDELIRLNRRISERRQLSSAGFLSDLKQSSPHRQPEALELDCTGRKAQTYQEIV